MRCPTLDELPAPDGGRTGWPWTEGTARLAAAMPDGRPYPRITVVTPSLNQASFLEETIRSVLLQGYPDLEYLVVDGGSGDASVEIIKKYQPWLAWSVSEADRGQADAINKGLGKATGEIFNWINSDDILQPGALGTIARDVSDGADIFAGTGVIFGQGREITPHANRNMVAERIIRGDLEVALLQPAIWFRRELLIRCGGLDPAFHYYFDHEALIRYLALFPRVAYLREPVAALRLHPDTKTSRHEGSFFDEYRLTLEKLSVLPDVEPIHRACRRRLAELDRHFAVARVLADGQTPKWRRAAALLWLSRRQPRPRMLHISAAAFRRLLRGQSWARTTDE